MKAIVLSLPFKATFPRFEQTSISADKLENYLYKEDFFYIWDDFYFDKFSRLEAISTARNIYWLKATEENKNLSVATDILHKIIARNLKRSDTIVAIGGGITLDIAAFCASVYKRGCRLLL
ncbi:MAG: hypothetical protein FWG20_07170, partial [Candidatus Cloacimonetes bacterium]|nr:hypothetical protein [Candidatus Cloacimonadota bacterium]